MPDRIIDKQQGVKVLSLFDGMSCGMLAFGQAGMKVDRYVAYEIDKYAIQVSTHNFPMIEQKGDVFQADFTEYEGFDAVVGGSPCTYWSIAQTKNRETEAHGIGWELFQQYVRAIKEAKPKFFIYENNKSMANAIKEEISNTFGFEPIMINSALVSAQRRQRYYWVGVRQEDGTYRKANIIQPEDRGILLRDVLDDGWVSDRDKSHTIIGSQGRTTHREYFQKNQGQMALAINDTDGDKSKCLRANYYKANVRDIIGNDYDKRTGVAEPINITTDGKSQTLKAQYSKNNTSNFVHDGTFGATGVAHPVNESDGKSLSLLAQYNRNSIANFVTSGFHRASGVAEPVAVRCRGRCEEDGNGCARYEASCDLKANTLDTNASNGSMVAEPVCMRYERTEEGKRLRSDYEAGIIHHGYSEHRVLQPRDDGKTNTLTTVQKDNQILVPLAGRFVGRRINEDGHRDDNNEDLEYVQRCEVNEDPFKTNCLTTVQKDNVVLEPLEPIGSTVLNINPSGRGINGEVMHTEGKSRCLMTNKGEGPKIITKSISMTGDFDSRNVSVNDKAFCLAANPSSDMDAKAIIGTGVCSESSECSEPIGAVGNMYGNGQNGQLFGLDSKTKTLSAGTGQTGRGIGSNNSPKAVLPVEVRGMSYPLKDTTGGDSGVIATLDMPGSHDILTRVFGTEGKSPTITAGTGGNKEPKVFSDTQRVKSTTKTPVYTVEGGQIEIKGKRYPIKLPDGDYIIRKLTVSECKRLQTVPEWYDMSVISNSQAYKCLGNGWTVDVIAHLIDGVVNESRSKVPTTHQSVLF
mgnify:CR=1 FL=1